MWLKVPRFSSREPALHGGEYAGNLAAAAENLGVIEDVLGFRNARDGNFFALQAFHVLRVLFGRDQFVVAAADELQQVVQELGNIGGADVVFEMQIRGCGGAGRSRDPCRRGRRNLCGRA